MFKKTRRPGFNNSFHRLQLQMGPIFKMKGAGEYVSGGGGIIDSILNRWCALELVEGRGGGWVGGHNPSRHKHLLS